MKKHYGPSLYYASDKNILDALNQHRVNMKIIRELFIERNILVSKDTNKEDLAYYFSRLTHDYHDHSKISARLGIAAKREKVTALDITSPLSSKEVETALEKLKKDISGKGEVVQISKQGDDFNILVQYTHIDYTKMEFKQIQNLDGTIQFIKSGPGYTVRNTQNKFMDNVRDTLLSNVESILGKPLEKTSISLFDVTATKSRSEFFHKLINGVDGIPKTDVTDVFVYKKRDDITLGSDDEDEDSSSSEDDVHIERVALKGRGVNQSKELGSLLEDGNEFYIVKVIWLARESMGNGHLYEIEAQFSNPRDCVDFSYLLRGVYPCEEGILSNKKRTPYKDEIAKVSLLVENAAKKAMMNVVPKD